MASAEISRSPQGLRDALFELLDGLRNGDVTARQARVQCEVAARIIDTGRLEVAMVTAAREGLELAEMIAGSDTRLLPAQEERP